MDDLEMRFHQAMLGIYDEATRVGYRPTRFLQMVNELGGLPAARQLLQGDAPSEGFVRLWELERLDLTVESLALREPWCKLFSADELRTAERRLAED